MRANQRSALARDGAEVGIGTMIVFIATVLVAAVAAAVLIDTSGKLQQRSTQTGQQTTQQVASNINVENIVGRRNGTTFTTINETEIFIGLAPGASTLDLSQVRIQVRNSTVTRTLNYTANHDYNGTGMGTCPCTSLGPGYFDSSSGNTTTLLQTFLVFSATAVRDADSSFSTSLPVLTPGDLVRIHFSNGYAGFAFAWAPRDSILMILYPEVGNKVEVGFSTPPSYGVDTIIPLK